MTSCKLRGDWPFQKTSTKGLGPRRVTEGEGGSKSPNLCDIIYRRVPYFHSLLKHFLVSYCKYGKFIVSYGESVTYMKRPTGDYLTQY